jgi:ComF family protein
MIAELVDIAFPSACLACGERPKPLCEGCLPEFGVHSQGHGLIFAAELDERLSNILSALKDKNRVALIRPLASGLRPALSHAIDKFSPTVIACPPSSRGNFLKRGFNPALKLFQSANPSSLVVSDKILRLQNQPKDQRRLDRLERRKNLEGVFAARRNQHRVLLVDDVTTTGSTLLAATVALEAAGAKVVGSCVLARRFSFSSHGDGN